jgi:hypothetical protein
MFDFSNALKLHFLHHVAFFCALHGRSIFTVFSLKKQMFSHYYRSTCGLLASLKNSHGPHDQLFSLTGMKSGR